MLGVTNFTKRWVGNKKLNNQNIHHKRGASFVRMKCVNCFLGLLTLYLILYYLTSLRKSNLFCIVQSKYQCGKILSRISVLFMIQDLIMYTTRMRSLITNFSIFRILITVWMGKVIIHMQQHYPVRACELQQKIKRFYEIRSQMMVGLLH